MNIRTLLFAMLSTCILSSTLPTQAMEKGLKEVADYAAIRAGEELTKAGTTLIATLPKKIDTHLSMPPQHLWTCLLSIAGALCIYQGINQFLHTAEKTEEKIKENKEDRTKLYKISAYKTIAGILSLGGSYAIWNWK